MNNSSKFLFLFDNLLHIKNGFMFVTVVNIEKCRNPWTKSTVCLVLACWMSVWWTARALRCSWDASSLQQWKDVQSLPHCSDCLLPSLPPTQLQSQTVEFAEITRAHGSALPCFRMFCQARILCSGLWDRCGGLMFLLSGFHHSYCISAPGAGSGTWSYAVSEASPALPSSDPVRRKEDNCGPGVL